MSRVFVVDTTKRPLSPCTPARARWMLKQGKAALWRRYPFTIILREARPDAIVPSLAVKVDPGSKTSGLAVVNHATGEVVFGAEITHRGHQVKKRLNQRRVCRRSRRQRHTHYRPARFNNRRRSDGWLPPSLESRIANILTWVERIRRSCPVESLSQELLKFDTQLMQDAEISGKAFQQGELAGYEVGEYVLEKFQRRCVYCGKTVGPLEIEHLIPKSRGGSNRVSNLAIACNACNLKKGNQTAEEFGYPDVQKQAKAPLQNAAAVNASRWALYRRLQATGLPVETGSGGVTKYNRSCRGIPKTHWLDAACVGPATPQRLMWKRITPLMIRAMGRHSRQVCRTNGAGSPDKSPKATSVVGGYRTGDIVKATVPLPSTKAGTYGGRIAFRASGSCNIKTASGTIQGIHYRHCQPLHRGDGYTYSHKKEGSPNGEALPPPA